MAKGSDNPFPSVLLAEQGSTPASPSAGQQRLFLKTADHLPYTVNSSGTVAGLGGGSGTFAGEVQGTDFKATGLTGAATAVRLVGANATGAPASGTFVAGDIAPSLDGKVWLCTTGGTPGTWAQIGGAGAMTQISKQVLGSTASSITISSIPGTYNTLWLQLLSQISTSNGGTSITAQFNADSSAHYDYIAVDTFHSSQTNTEGVAQTSGIVAYASDQLGSVNAFAQFDLLMQQYAGSTWKSYSAKGSWIQNQVSGDINAIQIAGEWRNTAALTSMVLTPSAGIFEAGTTAILYGIN